MFSAFAGAVLALVPQAVSANAVAVSAWVDRGSAALNFFTPACGLSLPCMQSRRMVSRYDKGPSSPGSVQPVLVKNPFVPVSR
jgi:hypothetical protein